MKISGSNIILSSDNNFEQMDLSLNQKTQVEAQIRTVRQNQASFSNPQILQQVLVDRVSISHSQTHEFQSNYSANVSSTSSVKSKESDDTIEYEQQFAIQRLVGGVINKDVVLRKIQRQEDISLPGEERTEEERTGARTSFNSQGGQPAQIQTRITQGWEMSVKQTDIHFEDQKTGFTSMGEVMTEDGRVINFSLDMTLNRTFLSRTEQETVIQKWQQRVNLTDPLVISLDGKAPALSDVSFEFDLNADGKTENINFVNSGSGFLAFDKNNDNIINDGSELFGPGTGNGFSELAAFDEDQNNWIDENDAVFSKLSVWTKDRDGNDKLISLKEAGVGAISLDYVSTQFNMTKSDNSIQGQLKSSGVFLFENGNVGSVHQIDLASRTKTTLDNTLSSPATPPEEVLSGATSEEVLSGATSNEFQPAEVANPMQELLDRIDELKAKMESLFEGMNPVLNKNRFGKAGLSYQDMTKIPLPAMFDQNRPIRIGNLYNRMHI
jgi:hypothetical protein